MFTRAPLVQGWSCSLILNTSATVLAHRSDRINSAIIPLVKGYQQTPRIINRLLWRGFICFHGKDTVHYDRQRDRKTNYGPRFRHRSETKACPFLSHHSII